jgi:exopolyphosphatase/guanosine-5'-triphosphate,3'-diphosphate pyrophosphatase
LFLKTKFEIPFAKTLRIRISKIEHVKVKQSNSAFFTSVFTCLFHKPMECIPHKHLVQASHSRHLILGIKITFEKSIVFLADTVTVFSTTNIRRLMHLDDCSALIGYEVNTPLRGQKAPLGGTPEKPLNERIPKSDATGEAKKGTRRAPDLPESVGKNLGDKDSDVSSGNPNQKKRRRRRRRNNAPNSEGHAEQQVARNKQQHNQKPGKQRNERGGSPGREQHANRKTQSHAKPYQNQQLYAALDLGTNNCRLLVARPTKHGQFHVVDAFSRIVRLGEGLAASGALSDHAMERAIGALKICASKLARHKIKKYRLIATEACRQASNGEAFLKRVKLETGLDLEMINRETEARLAVSGCASLVERDTKSVILFDIGGGSSEIAAIHFDQRRTARLANHIKSWTSLPVGVVTLSERFGGKDVTPEIFENMVQTVDTMLQETAPEAMLAFDPGLEDFHLLGTSGTVTTLAGLHLKLPKYDRRQVDGLWLADEDVDKMLDKLLSWDLKARSENPCIGPDRSDLVLAGCAIMQSIRKRWPSTRMRVADRGLREGLLNDMMARDGVWRRKRRSRNRKRKDQNNSNQPNSNVRSGEQNE